MGPRRPRALREDGTLPVTSLSFPSVLPLFMSTEAAGLGVEGLSGLGCVNVLSVLFWGWGWAFKALWGRVVTESLAPPSPGSIEQVVSSWSPRAVLALLPQPVSHGVRARPGGLVSQRKHPGGASVLTPLLPTGPDHLPLGVSQPNQQPPPAERADT